MMQSIDMQLTIRDFIPDDQAAFRRLNEEWIRRYFVMETKDEAVFADPQTTILKLGGRILIAVADGEAVGCCALVPMRPGEFEIAKMAVAESSRRSGVGRKLLTAAIKAARGSGASRVYLETSHKLTPAIRLYESMGFQHLPPERVTPSPYKRADVYMEIDFTGARS